MTPRQQAAIERRNRKLEAAYERGKKPIDRARGKVLVRFEKQRRILDAHYDKAISKLDGQEKRALKPIETRYYKLLRRTLDKRR